MSDEMDFFVYLMESYADHKGRCAGDVLREWDEHGITQTKSISSDMAVPSYVEGVARVACHLLDLSHVKDADRGNAEHLKLWVQEHPVRL